MANAGAQRKEMDNDLNSQTFITPRSSQVRRVSRVTNNRINNDWEYAQKQKLPQNATNDQIFNASYQNRGLQPQSLAANWEYAQKNASNDQIFNASYQNKGLQPKSEESEKPRISGRQILKEGLTEKLSLAKKNLARSKVSATNVSIVAWATPLWLTFQLPFAIISIVFFAIAVVFDDALNASLIAASGSWVGKAANVIAALAAKVADAALSTIAGLFGMDTGVVEIAGDLFLATWMITFAIGFFTLLIIGIQYTLALAKPISGTGMGFKIGMLILAFIGYSLPLLNLLPWALVWVLAVWLYPR